MRRDDEIKLYETLEMQILADLLDLYTSLNLGKNKQIIPQLLTIMHGVLDNT